ncbi:hypothetical protein [Allorhizocola rhizosphaerae]|uniref:hypothetical protein n=1 Tax=Allorhizocola rhizosphaerae TaxID=1872709 RepID=UPI000E3D6603|nr:hypothetical protein [Allorhizocola rhizosphaerae]
MLTSWVASRVVPEITLLVHPALDVTGDATVRLDARLGRTSSLTVPRVSAKTLFTDIAFTLSTPDGPISAGQGGRSFADFYTADLSGGAAVPGFISYISAVFGTSNADSPWTYTVGHREPRFISGYQRAFAEQEFAAIHTSYSGGDADGMLALWEAASSSLPDRSDTTPG